MYKISDKELLDRASENIGDTKRVFRRSPAGHFVGEGMEITSKTSKLTRHITSKRSVKTILHTMQDGRRIRYTIEIEPRS